MTTSNLLTVKNVAPRLGIKEKTLYDLASRRVIGSYKHRGAVRFSEEQVQAYLAAGKRDPKVIGPPTTSLPKRKLRHIKLDS